MNMIRSYSGHVICVYRKRKVDSLLTDFGIKLSSDVIDYSDKKKRPFDENVVLREELPRKYLEISTILEKIRNGKVQLQKIYYKLK